MSHFQQILHTCDARHCDAEVVTEMPVTPGTQLFKEPAPEGWSFVGNAAFCPKHKVAVVVDGLPAPQLLEKATAW